MYIVLCTYLTYYFVLIKSSSKCTFEVKINTDAHHYINKKTKSFTNFDLKTESYIQSLANSNYLYHLGQLPFKYV